MTDTILRTAAEEVEHKAKGLHASEMARAAANEDIIQRATDNARTAMREVLKEVFSNDNDKSPNEMRVLIQRVPILCTTVLQMHDDIKDLKDSQKWAVRIIIGAVLLAMLKMVLIP